MRPGSAVINFASVVALSSGGLPQAAYSASKAGLTGLTRDLAVQWTGRKGIRVNAPSSTTGVAPVKWAAAGLARNTTALASSSGSPGGPAGTRGNRLSM